jgi:hypothetical protein
MEEMEVYQGSQTDMVLLRTPKEVVEEARQAATMLMEIVKAKKKPVRFNGEDYLEFEDWLMVARFYSVSVKVSSTSYVEVGEAKGYECHAVALKDGKEISGAEAMCLDDERNWKGKPLFQLRSMAQTRACAKALRNVFSWIVVLSGFRPTPAEEMDGVIKEKVHDAEVVSYDNKENWEEFAKVGKDLGVSKDELDKFVREKCPSTPYSQITPPRIQILTVELKKRFASVS